MDIIQGTHPNAFFTVEALRSAEHGVFPHSPRLEFLFALYRQYAEPMSAAMVGISKRRKKT